MGEKGKKKLPLDTANVPRPLHPHPLLDRDRSLAEVLGQNGVSQQTKYPDPLPPHPGRPGFFVPQLHGASKPFTESFRAGACRIALPRVPRPRSSLFLSLLPASLDVCVQKCDVDVSYAAFLFHILPTTPSPRLCGFPEEAAIFPPSTHQL